jgi:hypothetical protein
VTPVSVCIATRGDVPLRPIFLSIPRGWEIVWWNNGDGTVTVTNSDAENFVDVQYSGVPDLGPHARFAAIEYASHDLILVQDDDVIVSDPQAIVDAWHRVIWESNGLCGPDGLHEGAVCNLPPEFREHYPDSSLVGFGACFHRDAPERAFKRFFDFHRGMSRDDPLFLRESCRVFTVLTPRVLVDIEKQDLPYASDPNRLWKDKNHIKYRDEALALAREVRDVG